MTIQTMRLTVRIGQGTLQPGEEITSFSFAPHPPYSPDPLETGRRSRHAIPTSPPSSCASSQQRRTVGRQTRQASQTREIRQTQQTRQIRERETVNNENGSAQPTNEGHNRPSQRATVRRRVRTQSVRQVNNAENPSPPGPSRVQGQPHSHGGSHSQQPRNDLSDLRVELGRRARVEGSERLERIRREIRERRREMLLKNKQVRREIQERREGEEGVVQHYKNKVEAQLSRLPYNAMTNINTTSSCANSGPRTFTSSTAPSTNANLPSLPKLVNAHLLKELVIPPQQTVRPANVPVGAQVPSVRVIPHNIRRTHIRPRPGMPCQFNLKPKYETDFLLSSKKVECAEVTEVKPTSGAGDEVEMAKEVIKVAGDQAPHDTNPLL
eukprot:GHVN01002420.1.p3 GENE.GHVN01002420.1~~GHVN01002420.1.p3  ORF type:complete len:382 (-),score=77.17 GHVN01002420.1:3501-4646(-)